MNDTNQGMMPQQPAAMLTQPPAHNELAGRSGGMPSETNLDPLTPWMASQFAENISSENLGASPGQVPTEAAGMNAYNSPDQHTLSAREQWRVLAQTPNQVAQEVGLPGLFTTGATIFDSKQYRHDQKQKELDEQLAQEKAKYAREQSPALSGLELGGSSAIALHRQQSAAEAGALLTQIRHQIRQAPTEPVSGRLATINTRKEQRGSAILVTLLKKILLCITFFQHSRQALEVYQQRQAQQAAAKRQANPLEMFSTRGDRGSTMETMSSHHEHATRSVVDSMKSNEGDSSDGQ